jgi:DNA-binding transcriptional ArsR family regulator
MADYTRLLAEDRRLTILRALAQDHDYSVNDFVLKRALESLGHGVSRDVLRGDLAWLRDQGLLRVRELDDGAIWVATATEDGVDVAGGRPHPGVARPAPR